MATTEWAIGARSDEVYERIASDFNSCLERATAAAPVFNSYEERNGIACRGAVPSLTREGLKPISSDLYRATARPDDHCSRLDDIILSLFQSQFFYSHGRERRPDLATIHQIRTAWGDLQGQARYPIESNVSVKWVTGLEEYTISGKATGQYLKPQDLMVVARWSKVNCRIALVCRLREFTGSSQLAGPMLTFLNMLSHLIEMNREANPGEHGIKEHAKVLVEWYLVTIWSRTLTMHYWWLLKHSLRVGHYTDGSARYYGVRVNHYMNPTWSVTNSRAKYMCGWALRSIKDSRATIGLDYEYLLTQYHGIFPNRRQRCKQKGSEPCQGKHPQDCGRFRDKSMLNPDQSIHSPDCTPSNCTRLFLEPRQLHKFSYK